MIATSSRRTKRQLQDNFDSLSEKVMLIKLRIPTKSPEGQQLLLDFVEEMQSELDDIQLEWVNNGY